jgi:hypothetical protein
MAYDKARQLKKLHPKTWAALDPLVKEIAQKYLRLELRQFRRELERLGWYEVKDVTEEAMREQFSRRLDRLVGDLRRPFPPLPNSLPSPSRSLMLVLALANGQDFISGLSERSQRRVWQEVQQQHGITRRSTKLPRKYHRLAIDHLFSGSRPPIHHGAPRRLLKAGLVAVR